MKKCRIYNTHNNSGYEYEGFPGDYSRHLIDAFLTDDGFVLLSFHEPQYITWYIDSEIRPPKKIIDGHKLYAYDAAHYYDQTPLPFEVDQKWGYCDSYSGEVVIEPQWDFCDTFHGDEARFNVGGKFDPLDKNEMTGNKWGFLNQDGWTYGFQITLVAPPVYQYLSRFEWGKALAKKDGFWGVIDGDGDLVVKLEWDAIWFDCNTSGFHNNFIVMKETDGRKQYSRLNNYGNVIDADIPDFIPPEFPKQYIYDGADEEWECEDGGDE